MADLSVILGEPMIGSTQFIGGGPDLITGLVGFWEMNEASGNALDSHGSNPLTDVNSVPAATGLVAGAREFTLGSKGFSHVDNADLSLGSDTPFTFMIWVYANSEPLFSGQALISKSPAVEFSNSCEYSLWFSNSSASLIFGVGNGSSVGSVAATPGFGVMAGNWYQLLAWHDPDTDTVNIQFNNGSVTSAAWSGGTLNGTEGLTIGVDPRWANALIGRIDNLAFWKRVLTPEERTWLYNSGASRSYADLVAGIP
jgi:hypothetical protein